MAAAQLIESLSALPQTLLPMGRGCKVTVIHVRIGEMAFGTSPGEGIVCATLRARGDLEMKLLRKRAEELARGTARSWNLDFCIKWTQEFPVTMNHPEAVSVVMRSAEEIGAATVQLPQPFPWSEDFGHFSSICPSVLFGLGAGVDHPALHSPEYDFPDGILAVGADIFAAIIGQMLREED